jgi:hypothetical protein
VKILFFCGSLEPGRDGVGDYTRRLAGACGAEGHECAVIALHDPQVSDMADLTTDHVRLIRLPVTMPWPDRLVRAGEYLRRLGPDWVSWQIVVYGFHQRGFLPTTLLQSASHLRGPRCHVMMHELWLGLEARAGWPARGIGWLQRRGVLCLLDQLGPECIETSQAAYQHALQREGFSVSVLGLFGNVPIAGDLPDRETLLARWLPAAADHRGRRPFVAVTFGSLHPQWRPGATADWLLDAARRRGRPAALLAIGRTGPAAAGILETFRGKGVRVATTGERDAADVSALLRAADCGIAPHPWVLIGKSGTAAAMLEHGLPVLVPRDDWQLRGAASLPDAISDPLLARLAGLDARRTDRWLAARRAPESGLARIAHDFLQSLGRASPDIIAPAL